MQKEHKIVSYSDKPNRYKRIVKCLILNRHEYELVETRLLYQNFCRVCGRKRI